MKAKRPSRWGGLFVCAWDRIQFLDVSVLAGLQTRLGQGFMDESDALVYGLTGSIQNDMLAGPGVIFPGDHVFPRRELEPGNIDCALLHAPPVFWSIGAGDLDLDSTNLGSCGHVEPGVARDRQGVH